MTFFLNEDTLAPSSRIWSFSMTSLEILLHIKPLFDDFHKVKREG